MTNKTMTSIRLSDRTRAQIDDLIEWGAATSMTDAIEEALRRMWENEKPKREIMRYKHELYTKEGKEIKKRNFFLEDGTPTDDEKDAYWLVSPVPLWEMWDKYGMRATQYKPAVCKKDKIGFSRLYREPIPDWVRDWWWENEPVMELPLYT